MSQSLSFLVSHIVRFSVSQRLSVTTLVKMYHCVGDALYDCVGI